MRYEKLIQMFFAILFITLTINISLATTHTGEGNYEVREGDIIEIDDSSAIVRSIDLDPRNDSYYGHTGKPRVYFSLGGVGYSIHEGRSSDLLLNKMSDRYVMTITVKEIDVDSGTALIYAEDYGYSYDSEATEPDHSDEKYIKYGPFNFLRNVQIGQDLIGFVYSNNLKDYKVKINDEEYGPFSSVTDFSISEDSFGFIFSSNSKDYVRINDEEYGPFDSVRDLTLSDNYWAFTYTNSSVGDFIQTKDSLLGPYNHITSQSLSGSTLGYVYREGGENNIVVDGEKVEVGSMNVEISKSGRYAFCYFEDKKGYCNIDGDVYGPYGTGIGAIVSDKYFIISYVNKTEDGREHYKIINDEKYGPYDYSYHSKLSDDMFAFSYDLEDNSFMNIKGEVYGPYDKSGALANLILDDGNYAYSYREDLNWVTIINGDKLNCPQGNQVSSIDFHGKDFIFSCSSDSRSNYVFVPKDYEDSELDEDGEINIGKEINESEERGLTSPEAKSSFVRRFIKWFIEVFR